LVAQARHKLVVEHPRRRTLLRLGVPAASATLVTGAVVGVALAAGETPAADTRATPPPTKITLQPADLADRGQSVSRSARRVTLEAKPEVEDREFMTTDLNVWPQPREKGRPLDVLDAGSKVALTGPVRNGFAQVLLDGQVRWVNADYLVDELPEPEVGEATDGVAPTGGTCTASPPSGVVEQAMVVYRAVCASFPSITTYGGWRNDGEHSDGHAIDVMVSGDLGWQVAEFLRAHAAELNLYDVIFSQRIFTQERAAEGWRTMEDRGSTTANHYDHVHVAVY
jgi:hypothetical protein